MCVYVQVCVKIKAINNSLKELMSLYLESLPFQSFIFGLLSHSLTHSLTQTHTYSLLRSYSAHLQIMYFRKVIQCSKKNLLLK